MEHFSWGPGRGHVWGLQTRCLRKPNTAPKRIKFVGPTGAQVVQHEPFGAANSANDLVQTIQTRNVSWFGSHSRGRQVTVLGSFGPWPKTAVFGHGSKLPKILGWIWGVLRRVPHLRKVQMKGQEKKKGTDDDVRKMSRGIMSLHDQMPASVTLEEAGQAMRGSGARQMEGASAALMDVKQLAPPTDSEDERDENVEQEEGEEEASEDKDKKAAKGKKKWFDRDRSVNRMHKSLRSSFDKMKESAETEIKKMKDLSQDVDKLPPKDAKLLSGDKSILVARLNCLEATLATRASLQDVIASYDEGKDASGNVSSTHDPLRGLGKAPPSRTFRDLKTFEEWRELLETVHEANTSDDLEKVKSACLVVRSPLADLVAAAKTAGADLSKGLKQLKKALERQPEKSSNKRRCARELGVAAAGAVFQLFDRIPKVSQVAEGEQVDVAVPAIIRCDSAKHAAFEKLPAVRTNILQELVQVFATQSAAQRVERAHKKFAPEIQSLLGERMEEIMKETKVPDEAPMQLKNALEVQTVIVAKNSWKCTTEKNHLGPPVASRPKKLQRCILLLELSLQELLA